MHKKIVFTLVTILVHAHMHAAQVKTAVQTEQDIFQLTLAAESGNIERLKELIASGANIHAEDASGWNAFDWAVHAEQLEVASYLYHKQSELDKIKKHFLTAWKNKKTNVTQFLFEKCGEIATWQVFEEYFEGKLDINNINELLEHLISLKLDVNNWMLAYGIRHYGMTRNSDVERGKRLILLLVKYGAKKRLNIQEGQKPEGFICAIKTYDELKECFNFDVK